MENILEVNNITKSFGSLKILKSISFKVIKGDFVTLLGPSGCGKTTTLRIISGLENPDSGQIIINGADVTKTPPEKRKVNTVFQNYALFPHMDVFNNIAYGLKIKNRAKDDIKNKVMEMLTHVRMEGYENRMPDQLSGGQRQRIAIARALVNEPDVLLLDEPLGAMDLKLRQHMQGELKNIQQSLGTTFIYVTHDQDEALNMSDKLIIMDEGNIRQMGTPRQVYEYPKNRFVAEFVGERNIIECEFSSITDGKILVNYAGIEMEASPNIYENKDETRILQKGDKVLATVHADKIIVTREKLHAPSIYGTVIQSSYTGAVTKTEIETKAGLIKQSEYGGDAVYKKGEKVYISWDGENCLIINE